LVQRFYQKRFFGNKIKVEKFSKKEAISFGWQRMKENFWFFVLLLVLVGIIQFGPDIIQGLLKIEVNLIQELLKKLTLAGIIRADLDFIGELLKGMILSLVLIINLIGFVLSVIVRLGLIKISLNFCDNLKSKISDLFSQYRLFFRYLFASILYGLICLLGVIFFIIPGIYFGIRFGFFDYFIVDKNSKIIESLKRSWQISEGNVWNLFLFYLLLFGINLLGVICLLIGLFATISTTMIAKAFVFRKLSSQLKV